MQQQQQEQMQMQMHQAEFQADMQSRQVSVLEGQLELDILKEQNRTVFDRQKQEHTEENADSKLLMEAEKMKHDMAIQAAELELERQQGRNVNIGWSQQIWRRY